MLFDPFLNRDDARAADDRFYAAHPNFLRRDGSRMNRTWCIGRSKALKSEWYAYYREAGQARRAPRTAEGPRDDVDPVGAVHACPYAQPALTCTPLASATLTSASYINKFLLLDETEKWTCDPLLLPYRSVDWTPTMERPNPVVVYFDDPDAFSLRITWRTGDEDACCTEGLLQSVNETGGADARRLAHHPVQDVSMRPGTEHEALARGIEYPPAQVGMKLGHGHGWEAIADGRLFRMGRPRNDVYLVWGPARTGLYPEDGPTQKRMHISCGVAGVAKSADELAVVKQMFDQFPGYVLGLGQMPKERREAIRADAELYAELCRTAWPAFFTDRQAEGEKAGAWHVMSHPELAAECQAICRLVRGMMRQMGAKSEIELRRYTADFRDPTRVLHGRGASGPNPDRHYALVDRKVTVGECYPRDGEVGFNRFEAYLKVTPPRAEGEAAETPKARLFGGGTGLLAEDGHPLACFQALVEFEGVHKAVELEDGELDVVPMWRITGMYDYQQPDSFKGWDGALP